MVRNIRRIGVLTCVVVLTVFLSNGSHAMMSSSYGDGEFSQGIMGSTQGMTGSSQGVMNPTQGGMEPTQGMIGSTQGMAGSTQGMMGPSQWMMGGGTTMGGRFEIADMNMDGIPEIVTLVNNTLVMMNTQGQVISSKPIEGINQGINMYMAQNPHVNEYMTQYMGQVWQNGMAAVFDVADLDGDNVPEIVIMDVEKMMILDNTGEPMGGFPVPWSITGSLNQ